VAAARTAREQALADRKETLVGANEFRDSNAANVSVLDAARVTVPAMPTVLEVEPLTPIRLAAAFEER
jgi:methylmalonyl-CoA mutase